METRENCFGERSRWWILKSLMSWWLEQVCKFKNNDLTHYDIERYIFFVRFNIVFYTLSILARFTTDAKKKTNFLIFFLMSFRHRISQVLSWDTPGMSTGYTGTRHLSWWSVQLWYVWMIDNNRGFQCEKNPGGLSDASPSLPHWRSKFTETADDDDDDDDGVDF